MSNALPELPSEIETELMSDALESLERLGCAFWACEGPTLEPIDMTTCHRCHNVARLRQHLGRQVVHLEETKDYARAVQIVRECRDAHRVVSIDQALSRVWARNMIEEFGSDPERS